MIRKDLHTYMNTLQEKDSILYEYREQRKSFIAHHQHSADDVLKEIKEQIIEAVQKELTGR